MIDSFSRLRRFVARIAQRFIEEDFDQISASLAFTTLLSLVPLVALMLSLIALAPFLSGFVERLDLYVVRHLLPSGSAGMITKYILQFSQKAAKVSVIGAVVLLVTVGFLLMTIERAFNHVWSVVNVRSWWRRLRLYAVLLALWPLVVGGVVAATSYAVTSSLGFVDEPRWLGKLLLNVMGVLLTAVFIGGLYFAVPFTRVAKRDAAWAGLFAAFGFLLMQRAFEFYLTNFPSYTAVYDAFATVPIFLLWLYLSWAVVLLGALVAATLPEFRQAEGAASSGN
jgi:membrane protein